MKLIFTDSQKEAGLNKIEIEDVYFEAYFIEGEGKNWIMTGSAVVEEEKYNDFTIEFETVDIPAGMELEQIMSLEWEWYDFLF